MKLITDADGVALVGDDGTPTHHITPEQWLEIGWSMPLAKVLEKLGAATVESIIDMRKRRTERSGENEKQETDCSVRHRHVRRPRQRGAHLYLVG